MRLKNIYSDDAKKSSFKVDEASAKACTKDALKRLSKKDRSVGTATMEDMMKEVHSAL